MSSSENESESESHESSEEEEEESEGEEEADNHSNHVLNEKNSLKSIHHDLQLLSEITSYVNLTSKRIQMHLPTYEIMKPLHSPSNNSNDKKLFKQRGGHPPQHPQQQQSNHQTMQKKSLTKIRRSDDSKDLLERAVDLVLDDYDSTSLSESTDPPSHLKRPLRNSPQARIPRGARGQG